MGIFNKLVKEAVESEDYDFEKLAYSFARSIISCLKNKNLSQKDLARKLNVSEAWISKVLSGDSNLTFKTMIKIARSLDCKVNDIVLSNNNFIYNSIVDPQNKNNTTTQEMNFSLIVSLNPNPWDYLNKNEKANYCFCVNTPNPENICTGLNS